VKAISASLLSPRPFLGVAPRPLTKHLGLDTNTGTASCSLPLLQPWPQKLLGALEDSLFSKCLLGRHGGFSLHFLCPTQLKNCWALRGKAGLTSSGVQELFSQCTSQAKLEPQDTIPYPHNPALKQPWGDGFHFKSGVFS
jgi:hypothetical protein